MAPEGGAGLFVQGWGLDGSTTRLVGTAEAARHLGVSPRTLEDWRWKGGGPTFSKLGRLVRYRMADLEAFVSGSLRSNTGGGLAA